MSLQLVRYLHARATGAAIESACEQSGIGLAEAALWEEAIAKGEVEMPKINQEGEVNVPKHETEIENPTVGLAAETLRGDVRDAILSWVKSLQKPWGLLTEAEQRDLCEGADRLSRTVVKEAAEIIARGERPCVVAKLVEYKEKDGVEAKLKLGSTEDVIRALHEACGQEVLLVTTGAVDFSGEQAPAESHVESDQRDLGIGAEYEEAA